MSIAGFVDTVARLWQSRWLTAAVLVPFAAVAARGLLVGLRELNDVDQQVRVELHFAHTQMRDLSIAGRATYFSLRNDRTSCVLRGPFEVNARCRDADEAMLHLELGWEDAGPGDTFRVADPATGQNWLVGNLVAHRTTLRVPLARPHTTIRFVPSHPSLGVRVYGAQLKIKEMTPLGFDLKWDAADDTGSIALGAGFWPRVGADRHAFTKRCAFLRVDVAAPGPHILQLAFSRLDPDAAMPSLTLAGKPIWSPGIGITEWSRADTEQGATTLQVKVDLAATNVIGIECPGRFASSWERGVGPNMNRIAYDLSLDRCTVAPVK